MRKYLDYNDLLDIGHKTFLDLKNLSFLHLASNNLVELESKQFEGLINLETIYLVHINL